MTLYCYQITEPRVVFCVGEKICYKTIDCTFKGKLGRRAHLLMSKERKKRKGVLHCIGTLPVIKQGNDHFYKWG